MFGIPEKTSLDNEYNIIDNNDKDKISFLFNYIEADENNIKSFFRLGKEGDKPRPIKIILGSRDHTKDSIAKSSSLREY